MDEAEIAAFIRRNMRLESVVEGNKLTITLFLGEGEVDSTTIYLPRIPEPTFGPLPKDNTAYQYTGPTLLDLVKLATDARSTITLNDNGEVTNQAPHKVF